MNQPRACVDDRRTASLGRRFSRGAGIWLAISIAIGSPCAVLAYQSPQNNEEEATSASTPTDDGAAAAKGSDVSKEPLDLSFDDLKFDIEKGAEFKESMLTEEIKKFDGRKIRIRGFVRPGFKQSGIKNFILVRDNQQCCFGPGAALYDCLMVKMAEDQAIDFTVRPISVVGTMQLKKYVGKDGKVWAIFRLNETHQDQ